jgi:hypothetical protein
MQKADEVVRASATNQKPKAFCDESGVGFAAHLAENSTALWSHHIILRSDETWLPEWSVTWAECSGGAVRSRRVSWGKPVFRLTASSQLAESLARGRVQFLSDGTSTQAERRPG